MQDIFTVLQMYECIIFLIFYCIIPWSSRISEYYVCTSDLMTITLIYVFIYSRIYMLLTSLIIPEIFIASLNLYYIYTIVYYNVHPSTWNNVLFIMKYDIYGTYVCMYDLYILKIFFIFYIYVLCIVRPFCNKTIFTTSNLILIYGN